MRLLARRRDAGGRAGSVDPVRWVLPRSLPAGAGSSPLVPTVEPLEFPFEGAGDEVLEAEVFVDRADLGRLQQVGGQANGRPGEGVVGVAPRLGWHVRLSLGSAGFGGRTVAPPVSAVNRNDGGPRSSCGLHEDSKVPKCLPIGAGPAYPVVRACACWEGAMGHCVCHRPTLLGAAHARGTARLLLVVAALLLAACSSNGSSSPTTVRSPASTSTATSALATTPTTVRGTTTTSTALSTTTSAPSTTTTSTTLAGATTTIDPDVRPVPPEDMPMVDAYKAYLVTFIQAASSSPVDAEATPLVPLTTPDFVAQIRAFLKAKREAGAVLNVSLGVTPRPFVVAAPRTATEVYVNDCQLDGSFWADAAGNPLPGQKAQVKRIGFLTKMTLVDGSWVVAGGGEQGGACVRS